MNNIVPGHNQPIEDPVAHFKAIPWCAKLLTDRSVIDIQIPDRTPLASSESALVRQTLNTMETVRACIVFLRYIKPTKESLAAGETKEKPFLELVTLLDLGKGVNGFAGTAHGGFFGVVLDEVMGSAVKAQSDHVGYTVYLNVQFKKPLYTPQVVAVRGRVHKREGKKIFVKGRFEDKDGEAISEADGMWVMTDKESASTDIKVSKL